MTNGFETPENMWIIC